MSATVCLAMPVWPGEGVLAETLRSIIDQTYPHWRVVVSVDGGDQGSAALVHPFLADPRITLVVQPSRLGWAGNLNTLMGQADEPYWMYWQQDDLCAANYLDRLVRYLEAHPEAGAAFADVQWFGGRIERVHTPSVTGFAVERVLRQTHTLSYLPFRAVIRREMLAAAGPLRLATSEAAFEDLVWNVQLAREAELHHVDGTLYFKRASAGTAHAAWSRWPATRRRAAWLECALGVFAAGLPVMPPRDRARWLEAVVERFALDGAGLGVAYGAASEGPAAFDAFVSDLLAGAAVRFAVHASATPTGHDAPASAAIARVLRRGELLTELRDLLAEQGSVAIGAGTPGVTLLGRGWSVPESWGVWSQEATAEIAVPLPARAVVIRLRGQIYTGGLAAGAVRRVVARVGGSEVAAEGRLEAPDIELAVRVAATAVEEPGVVRVTVECLDAVAPADLGLSVDTRRLGLALTSLEISVATDNPPAVADERH